MSSTPEPRCTCCLESQCSCHGDILEPNSDHERLLCSCCLDKFCACQGLKLNEAAVERPVTVRWTYAAYSPYSPMPGWTVQLTRRRYYMDPATAREMAADLISAAEHAEKVGA